jgi:ATPase subunit of ABC transporter with duplicated ATPase domains
MKHSILCLLEILAGKSTLLRHMARHDIHGAGAQKFPENVRVLHVEQEVCRAFAFR